MAKKQETKKINIYDYHWTYDDDEIFIGLKNKEEKIEIICEGGGIKVYEIFMKLCELYAKKGKIGRTI